MISDNLNVTTKILIYYIAYINLILILRIDYFIETHRVLDAL